MFGSDDVFYSRTTRQYLYHITPLMPIQHSAGGTKVWWGRGRDVERVGEGAREGV